MILEVTVSLLNLLLMGFAAYGLRKYWRHQPLAGLFWPALLFKCLMGILLGVVYHHFYHFGDTLLYFSDAKTLAQFFYDSPGSYFKSLFFHEWPLHLKDNLHYLNTPRALLQIKFLSFLSIMTHHNYWIMSLYCSLISAVGFWRLASVLTRIFPLSRWAAIASFLFFPSVVFWSSGIIKESMVMGAMCLSLSVFIPYLTSGKRPGTIAMLLGLLGLFWAWKIKYYYAGALISVLISGLMMRWLDSYLSPKSPKVLIRCLAWCLVWVGLLFTVSRLKNNLHLENITKVIVKNHDVFVSKSMGDNLIHYSPMDADGKGVLENIPLALFSGLFRPALWDSWYVGVKFFFSLENLALLVLAVTSLPHLGVGLQGKYWYLICMVLGYTLLLATFLALSTPNFGTLVRYKAGFQPFFVYLVMVGNPWVGKIGDWLSRKWISG